MQSNERKLKKVWGKQLIKGEEIHHVSQSSFYNVISRYDGFYLLYSVLSPDKEVGFSEVEIWHAQNGDGILFGAVS